MNPEGRSATLAPPQAAAQAVAKLLRVPGAHRRFTVARAAVRRGHGIGEELLDQLLDLGLPHDGDTFDRLDLDNAGLSLGLECPRRTAMRWWSRALMGSGTGTGAASVSVTANCPSPGHAGDCEFSLAGEAAGALAAEDLAGPGRRRYTLTAACGRADCFFGEPFTALLDLVRPLEFHVLPHALSADLGFLAETGLADCELASAYLAREGTAMGLPVRVATGIFVAPPYPAEHCWIDCRVGGRWLAADPFLLTALARWGVIDGAQWPGNRSLEAVLWRTGHPLGRLVTHTRQKAQYLITVRSRPPGNVKDTDGT